MFVVEIFFMGQVNHENERQKYLSIYTTIISCISFSWIAMNHRNTFTQKISQIIIQYDIGTCIEITICEYNGIFPSIPCPYACKHVQGYVCVAIKHTQLLNRPEGKKDVGLQDNLVVEFSTGAQQVS